jgi:hypothetical protein
MTLTLNYITFYCNSVQQHYELTLGLAEFEAEPELEFG